MGMIAGMKPRFFLLAFALAGCGGGGSVAPETRWNGHPLGVTSTAFADHAPIPAKCARGGDNKSPLLQWTNPPAGVEDWAVICEDDDASGGAWVHWVVYGLGKEAKGLPEGVPDEKELKWPAGARQGENSWGHTRYDGPDPPGGSEHRYRFIVYALSAKLTLAPGATAEEVREAVKATTIGRGEVVGTFKR